MHPTPPPALEGAGLSAQQHHELLQPLYRGRVHYLNGQSHLQAWDVRRHLIRIFGFGGFDVTTLGLDLVTQVEHPPGTITYGNGGTNDTTRWTVVYRAQVRLVVKDLSGRAIATYDDASAGDSIHQPVLGDAHDHAMKTALSSALKRCVVNLGDQFGLSLYNNGNLAAVVGRTLASPVSPVPGAEVAEDVQGDGLPPAADSGGGPAAGFVEDPTVEAWRLEAAEADTVEALQGLYRAAAAAGKLTALTALFTADGSARMRLGDWINQRGREVAKAAGGADDQPA